MADQKKISALPLASEVKDGDVFVGVQDGVTKRTAATSLKSYILKGWTVAEDYADPTDPDDTLMIQRAINAVYASGGGEIHLLPKTYEVSVTSETLPVMLISAGGALNPTTTLTQSCIVLRAGVTLVGAGVRATVINAPAIQRSSVSLYEMDGGGLQGMTILGGKGVTSVVATLEGDNCNMVLDNLEIADSSSYGLGVQMGFNYNNRYSRLYVHDTGQDAIDHKARAKPSTGAIPFGNSFHDILVERYGQTSATESAGMDLRGQQEVNNVVCRDFSVAGKNNIGIRFSTGVTEVNDKRVGSSKSSLTNFYINSGNATDTGIVGLAVYESSHDCVSNGVIENCHTGVNLAATTSGNGTGAFLKMATVEVFGSRGNSFQTTEDRTGFIGCHAIAAEDYFSEGLDNLVVGQTVFPVPRTFVSAIVKVYKNDVLLTLTTDYTLTGTTAVNLVVPVITGDILRVQTPGSRGFNFQAGAEGRSGTNGTVVGCTTKGMVTPVDASVLCKASLMEGMNQFEGCGFSMVYSATSAELQATGSATDIEGEIRSKGAAGVTARSNGARAFRAVNPASAVNWTEVQGAATGSPARFGAAGSDTNIDVLIQPKGSSGRVRIGTLTASADAPITGYIEIKDAAGTLRKLAVIA